MPDEIPFTKQRAPMLYVIIAIKLGKGLLLLLALNAFIVWYLFQNRHRLFRRPACPRP